MIYNKRKDEVKARAAKQRAEAMALIKQSWTMMNESKATLSGMVLFTIEDMRRTLESGHERSVIEDKAARMFRVLETSPFLSNDQRRQIVDLMPGPFVELLFERLCSLPECGRFDDYIDEAKRELIKIELGLS